MRCLGHTKKKLICTFLLAASLAGCGAAGRAGSQLSATPGQPSAGQTDRAPGSTATSGGKSAQSATASSTRPSAPVASVNPATSVISAASGAAVVIDDEIALAAAEIDALDQEIDALERAQMQEKK